jgi:hypothetical protein
MSSTVFYKKKKPNKYFAKDCLVNPSHNTASFENMRPVEDYDKVTKPYYESNDDWCVDCEDVYQHTCMKGYQNLYNIKYPNQSVEYKKHFLEDYTDMLNDIDNIITTSIKSKNPLNNEYIKEAIIKGNAADKFLDSCIALRLNYHKNCVRRTEDLQKELKDIKNEDLQGDKGHKEYIDKMRTFKALGKKVKTDALKVRYLTTRSPIPSKKLYRSRARGNKSLKSRKTRDLIIKKKSLKRMSVARIKRSKKRV